MDFIKGNWSRYVDVHDFIQHNYTPYDGDESFLSPPTEKTKKLWAQVRQLMDQEVQNGGVLDIDEHTISDIDAYAPGYICKDLEDIVGLQTDAPLKRAILPFGGKRMVIKSLEPTAAKWIPRLPRCSNTANPTTTAYSTLHRRNEAGQAHASSPACRTLMAGDASLATTGGCRFTAWIFSLRTSSVLSRT